MSGRAEVKWKGIALNDFFRGLFLTESYYIRFLNSRGDQVVSVWSSFDLFWTTRHILTKSVCFSCTRLKWINKQLFRRNFLRHKMQMYVNSRVWTAFMCSFRVWFCVYDLKHAGNEQWKRFRPLDTEWMAAWRVSAISTLTTPDSISFLFSARTARSHWYSDLIDCFLTFFNCMFGPFS